MDSRALGYFFRLGGLSLTRSNLTMNTTDTSDSQNESNHYVTRGEIMEMPTIENVYKPGHGYAGGDLSGLGGGGLGLIALMALLGNNRNGGFLNGGSGEGSGVNQITLGQIQGTLGDIKAAVPLAEAQVQLALAGQAQQLMSQMSANAQSALSSDSETRRDIAAGTASNNLGFGTLGLAIANSTYSTTTAVRDDGDKTRALITAQNEANLQRMLTVAENALAEQRAGSRARDIEVNVTQNQNQLQLQAQAQLQAQTTNALLQQLITQSQVAQATNQSLIIGNTGGVRSGDQTANPVNVRA